MNEAWYEENNSKVSVQSAKQFARWTKGLKLRKDFHGNPMPFGSQAHIIPALQNAIHITDAKNVLEIGFNIGMGSAILLGLGVDVVSVEVNMSNDGSFNVEALRDRYGERFEIITCPSGESYDLLKHHRFDLCWVDGDHSEAGVSDDIELCKALGIRWLLFDDWLSKHGPGVQPSIIKHGLVMEALMRNTALCDAWFTPTVRA